MSLTTQNTDAISFKKIGGKTHTQQSFSLGEEKVSSNIQLSYSTLFANKIEKLPVTNSGLTSLYSTNGVVERVKFQLDIITDTQIGTNRSQGYRLKLPADYNTFGDLYPTYVAGTYLHAGLGRLQIVPAIYGELKADGSTEYDPILYQTNGTSVIAKYDPINWFLDTYSGILFVQDPPAGYDISSARPGYIEAFLYVGSYLNDVLNITSSGSTGTTASNIGTGIGVYATKVGQDLRFKSIRGGNGITVSGNSTSLIVTYTGATGGGGDGTITGATNGLRVSGGGRKIALGGVVTGATTIGLGTNNLTFTGTTATLRYGGNYSSNFVNRSLVDVSYVTGITTTLLTKTVFNGYTGTTAPATYLLKSTFNTYTGTTAPNLYITGATNGLTKQGRKIRLGGIVTGATTIGLGVNSIVFTGTTGTLRYGGNYSANFVNRSLVDVGYVTGLTSTLLTISRFNTYSGSTGLVAANNGLTKVGNRVKLGGSVTGQTSITIPNSGYTLNIVADDGVRSITQSFSSQTFATTGKINADPFISIATYFSPSIGRWEVAGYNPTLSTERMRFVVGDISMFTDYRTVKTGIQYAGDYSTGFTNSSLVHKGYVTGLTNIEIGVRVTSNYTANTTSNFIGVSATTSMGVYLPPNPKQYQKVFVKDIKGNGLTTPITINGNGKLIDGSSTATINTNYGGIQFIYNTFNWSVVGFA